MSIRSRLHFHLSFEPTRSITDSSLFFFGRKISSTDRLEKRMRDKDNDGYGQRGAAKRPRRGGGQCEEEEKREERNRGGTRDAFKLVSTSVHPPLPSPLSPQCFLHREAEKEEFVFFLRHTKSRVYVKERAADYLSSSIPPFFPFFFRLPGAWRWPTPAILSTRSTIPWRALVNSRDFSRAPIWLAVGRFRIFGCTVNRCDSTCLTRDNGEFTTELRFLPLSIFYFARLIRGSIARMGPILSSLLSTRRRKEERRTPRIFVNGLYATGNGGWEYETIWWLNNCCSG